MNQSKENILRSHTAEFISNTLTYRFSGPRELYYAVTNFKVNGPVIYDTAVGVASTRMLAATRSYFEAIERYSVFRKPEHPGPYIARTLDNQKIQLIPDQIFLEGYNGEKYIKNSSGGCAAHINLLSAQHASLLELIEKDNLIRHWSSKKTTVQIDPHSFPVVIKLWIPYLENLGYKLHILDMSHFSNIYTYGVFLTTDHVDLPACVFGSAANILQIPAAIKAFEESLGSLLIFLKLNTKAIKEYRPIQIESPEDHKKFYFQHENIHHLERYLLPERYNQLPPDYRNNIILSPEKDIVTLTGRLKEYNIYPTWYRLTPPEVEPTPVFRCVANQFFTLHFGLNSEGTTKIPHPFG